MEVQDQKFLFKRSRVIVVRLLGSLAESLPRDHEGICGIPTGHHVMQEPKQSQ